MTVITREILIDASPEAVWAVLSDFGNVSRTNPSIVNSHLTSEQAMGIGTTRHCDLNMMGAQLEERISGWKENELLQIDIYQWKNLPGMETMSAEFSLHPEAEQTRLRASMTYQLKWGIVGKAMDGAMMRSQNSKGWTEFLAGIKQYVETGVPVDSAAGLDTSLVMIPA